MTKLSQLKLMIRRFIKQSVKFLSLYIDDELSWKYHVDQIATKISKMTEIMARARHCWSIQTLKTIYDKMEFLINCSIK